MALTTDFLFRVKAIESGSPDLSVLKDTLDYMKNLIWASGTGANQADVLWHDQRTLTASATEDLDLAGSLTGVLAGTTLTYVELKGLIIFAAAANTNDVQLTRPASNGVPLFLAASDGLAVGPGGLFVWLNPGDGGVTVTAGTGDLLTLTNSAGGTSVVHTT